MDRSVAVVGAYEHPTRLSPDKSEFQLMAEACIGALDDAGLKKEDIDGLTTLPTEFIGGNLTRINLLVDYLNLDPRWVDSTLVGGTSMQFQFARAAMAIRQGLARCVLVVFGATPKSQQERIGTSGKTTRTKSTELKPNAESYEDIYGLTVMGLFGMTTQRHMALYGTTEEHLAHVSVTLRKHAGLNPHAKYRDPITVEDVLNSRYIAHPLRMLNCCVISDGAGALIVAHPDVVKQTRKKPVWLIGTGEAMTHTRGGHADWLDVGTRAAGKTAFAQAGITTKDVKTLQVYDATSFHIIQAVEELGFCERGEGGPFLDGGRRITFGGDLPINTDGGGMSSNQVGTRGPFVMIEAVRQARGECGDWQVPEADIVVASATGGGGGGGQGPRRSASVLVFARD
jgi:acetyl-CoA C-acetyltransferase